MIINYYCLEDYEEVKDLNDSNTIRTKKSKSFERDKTGKRYSTAFQLFQLLTNNIDTLVSKMPLTDEISNTQCYDKVDEYKTFEHNLKRKRNMQIRRIRRNEKRLL